MAETDPTPWWKSDAFKTTVTSGVILAVVGALITLCVAWLKGGDSTNEAAKQSGGGVASSTPHKSLPDPVTTTSGSPSSSASSSKDVATPSTDASSPAINDAATVPLTELDQIVKPEDLDLENVTMNSVDYGTSFIMYCLTDTINPPANKRDTWSVAGHNKFTATLGIPDKYAPSEDGAHATLIFTSFGKPLIDPVTVTPGAKPKPITIPLNGVSQLAVRCVDVPGPTGGQGTSHIQVALGKASVS
jgi:hypothetical protein